MNNLKVEVIEEATLKNFNTYKINAKAKYLVKVKDIDSLREVLKYCQKMGLPYFILGAGSNVILDEYFKGMVIKIEIDNFEIKDKIVTCGAGMMMGKLAKRTIDDNLTGLEWAINIPGTVGGSIVGNAGAYNSEMFDNLVKVKVLDKNLEIKTLKKEEIQYGYRHTNLKDAQVIVLEGTFKLEAGNKEESLALVKDRCERRMASQPLDMPSAGSVFRNPQNDHAGRLIEEAGLKGRQIGGAKVSEKHANFIVNTGTATSNDIKNLIRLIQDKIKEKYNIDLILEQEIVDWKN